LFPTPLALFATAAPAPTGDLGVKKKTP
jgi:hypothetical protein